MEAKQSDKPKNLDPHPSGKQTDLAEGELETVEESIRIHQQKGDLTKPKDTTAPQKGR
jgi:hypothetical protein